MCFILTWFLETGKRLLINSPPYYKLVSSQRIPLVSAEDRILGSVFLVVLQKPVQTYPASLSEKANCLNWITVYYLCCIKSTFPSMVRKSPIYRCVVRSSFYDGHHILLWYISLIWYILYKSHNLNSNTVLFYNVVLFILGTGFHHAVIIDPNALPLSF